MKSDKPVIMASRRDPPVEITSPRFEQRDKLTANDLKRVVAPSFATAAAALIEGWKKEPVLMVGLHLSPENDQVNNSTALVQGLLYKSTKTLDVQKIWATKANWHLKLEPLDLAKFDIGGVLVSDFLDSPEIEHSFIDRAQGGLVSNDDLTIESISGFCLRIFLSPMTSKTASLTVLIFPLPKTTLMADYRLAEKHSFPGIVITRAEITMGPQTKTITDKIYGSPLMPVLVPTNPITSNTVIPEMCQLAGGIAALLQRVGAPDCKNNHKTLKESWDAIKKDGESRLVDKGYDKKWPSPIRVSAEEGK